MNNRCPYCEKLITSEDTYCPRCGIKLDDSPAKQHPTGQHKYARPHDNGAKRGFVIAGSIICAVIILFIILLFAGNSPKTVVNDFCEAMADYNFSQMKQYMISGDNAATDFEADPDNSVEKALWNYMKKSAKEMEYKIVSTDSNGASATVEVNFKYVDAEPVVTAAIGDLLPQIFAFAFSDSGDELLEAAFISSLTSQQETIGIMFDECMVIFTCTKTDDGWRISDISENFINPFTCNIAKISDKLDSLGSDSEEETTVADEDIVWHDVPQGTEIELATMKVRVLDCVASYELGSGDNKMTAVDGTKFVVFTLEIENITKDTITLNFGGYSFFDSEERHYELYDDAYWYIDNSLQYEDLAPNMPVTGCIVYNIPEKSSGYYFQIIKSDTIDGYRFYGNEHFVSSGVQVEIIEPTEAAETETASGSNSDEEAVTGYVVNTSGGLNVRSGPGTEYSQVDRIYDGAVLTIYEIQEQGTTSWGRVDNGWVCMDYISFTEPADNSASYSNLDVPQYVIDEYTGKWGDVISQRCMMDVAYHNGQFYFTITWGNSASSTSQWEFVGTYYSTSDKIVYCNGKHSALETSDNGTTRELVQYTNGEGEFMISDGYMYWEDYIEAMGINCMFEKYQ